MIISKTPFRLSFFGGGTDYPQFYLKHGGAVLSTTIDKYIFVSVKAINGISDFRYKLNYSKLEACNEIDEIQHPVIRACLRYLNIEGNIEIHVIADLPARTGIGSSSSFTVGLLHALYVLKNEKVSKDKLAMDAIHIEQVILKERVGVQDQLAAAHGGLNHMRFNTDGGLFIAPVVVNEERVMALQSSLLVFYAGVSRYAHTVLEEQLTNTTDDRITGELTRLRSMVDEGISILQSQTGLDSFGDLMHEAWTIKRSLSSAISNKSLDKLYSTAREAGALGGKLLGAGGGGFFVFYVPEEKKENVIRSLGIPNIPIRFEREGSVIVLSS